MNEMYVIGTYATCVSLAMFTSVNIVQPFAQYTRRSPSCPVLHEQFTGHRLDSLNKE